MLSKLIIDFECDEHFDIKSENVREVLRPMRETESLIRIDTFRRTMVFEDDIDLTAENLDHLQDLLRQILDDPSVQVRPALEISRGSMPVPVTTFVVAFKATVEDDPSHEAARLVRDTLLCHPAHFHPPEGGNKDRWYWLVTFEAYYHVPTENRQRLQEILRAMLPSVTLEVRDISTAIPA